VQEGVEVKLVPGLAGDETFILARSADRREKEKAMHERFVQRLEEALRKTQSAAECGRLRCVTEPDEAQKTLLHRLGVTLPRRLRRIDEVVPM
jgi:hypothetical protein